MFRFDVFNIVLSDFERKFIFIFFSKFFLILFSSLYAQRVLYARAPVSSINAHTAGDCGTDSKRIVSSRSVTISRLLSVRTFRRAAHGRSLGFPRTAEAKPKAAEPRSVKKQDISVAATAVWFRQGQPWKA